MRFKAYVGRSLTDLAPQIREELGPEAVILSQRESVRGGVGGFFGTRTIEVLAADRAPVEGELPDELAVSAPTEGAPVELAELPAATTDTTAPELDLGDPVDIDELLRAALAEAGAVEEAAALGPAPAAEEMDEVDELEEAPALPEQEQAPAPQRSPLVSAEHAVAAYAPTARPRRKEKPALEPAQEAAARAPKRAPKPTPPAAPPEVDEAAELVSELTRAGVAPDVAESLVAMVTDHVMPFSPGAELRSLVRGRIAGELRTSVGWAPTGAPHLIALAGPTGSGKTSLAVKLAERYVEAGMSAAVITLQPARPDRDSLAARMGGGLSGGGVFDVVSVGSISSARAARRALAHHDLVLIDTPGLAGEDAEGLAHLGKLLAELKPDEVHAVVPVSLHEREMEAVLARLASLGADRIAVTKLDEARAAGALVNLCHRREIELSYLGTGPRIPADVAIADGVLIAERVLPI